MRRAAVAGVLLAASAASAAWAAPSFALRGSVVLAPTCSGPDLERPGCSQAWVDAPLVLHDAAGVQVLGRQASGAGGQFRFALPAGRYRLSVQTDKITRCPVLEVELPAMHDRPQTIDCDTGRR